VPETITSPYYLVCEGKADEVFFNRLLRANGKTVAVKCPEKETDGAPGKDAIFRRLKGLESEFDKLTRVVLALDSDDDPAKAFLDGCNQLRKAGRYPIPMAVNQLESLEGAPSTAIVLVPSESQKGCLDTLLLAGFKKKYSGSIVTCVDTFHTCIGADRLDTNQSSKAFLRSIITATQNRNPGVSLSYLLTEKSCPISITDSMFDDIRDRLIGLFP
jgi:hypothetical protein